MFSIPDPFVLHCPSINYWMLVHLDYLRQVKDFLHATTPQEDQLHEHIVYVNPTHHIGRNACRTVGGNNVRIKGLIVSLIEHPSYSYVAIDAVFEKTCMQKDLQTDSTVWKASGGGLYLQSSLSLCMSIM